jgi:hypothetical protein
MNRTSSILLWVVLTIGAIVLSSIYLFGQSQLSKPASSLTVNRPSVAPVNTEFTSTPATPTISVPSESAQNPNPTSNPELSLATSSSPVGGWITYANAKFGFSFSSPDTFQVRESRYPLTNKDLELQDAAYFYGVDVLDSKFGVLYFGISVAKTRFSLNDYESTKTRITETESPWIVVHRKLNKIDGYESSGYTSEGHVYGDRFHE